MTSLELLKGFAKRKNLSVSAKGAAMTLRIFAFTFYLYILTLYSEKCRDDSQEFVFTFYLYILTWE